MKNRVRVGILLLFALFAPAAAPAGQVPAPPAQPESGPGGRQIRCTEVSSKLYGAGAKAYWLFEPASPKPKSAPVIVFSHGWSAMQPAIYGAWIEHLVRRGNIVIYPVYQDSLRTPVADFTPNAIAAVTDALHRLQSEPGHVVPDLKKFALVGHSMGGVLSANMAALWNTAGLPRPRALMCVQPGKTWSLSPKIAIHLEELARIPKETLMLSIVGDRDTIVRDIDAKRIFREATNVPRENKNFVTLVSDEHGWPPLRATHFAPVAPDSSVAVPSSGTAAGLNLREQLREWVQQRRETQSSAAGTGAAEVFGMGVDALDFYGTWKLLDALTDAAFYGKNREFALGNTPKQRFMGRWSDGVPVKELIVTDNP